jgi:hypothetical protein
MVPPAMEGDGDPAANPRLIAQLDGLAYGVAGLAEERYTAEGLPAPPRVPALWNIEMIGHLASSDSQKVVAIDPALVTVRGKPRAIWLAVRVAPNGRTSVAAVADDRTGNAGQPLFYSASDSMPGMDRDGLLELGPEAFRPDAPPHRLEGPDRHGVEVGGLGRRVMLAWALQAGRLLSDVPPGSKVDWRLSPAERLVALAPFARWGEPVPRIINRALVWVTHGYVAPRAFPLSSRLLWREREIGALHAGFLATVEAATGVTRIYLRPGANATAAAWAAIAQGVVEPASAIPEVVLRAAPYPVELFRVQARYLEERQPQLGSLGGPPGSRRTELPATDGVWGEDSTGPIRMAIYERAGEHRVAAVLTGSGASGVDELRLVRFDSAAALESRSGLEGRWSHFATYDALGDSIAEDGGRLERGPVRIDLGSGGPVAYQSHFARDPRGNIALSWVSVAAPGDRLLGAGRSLREAWSNLLGATVPSVAGMAQATRLEEARRWLQRADSALRAGDWNGFGTAWDHLRDVLGTPATPRTDELARPRGED